VAWEHPADASQRVTCTNVSLSHRLQVLYVSNASAALQHTDERATGSPVGTELPDSEGMLRAEVNALPTGVPCISVRSPHAKGGKYPEAQPRG
jgi:hypothetical protein